MIYRVKLDNTDIYANSMDMALLSPSAHIELNAAGSCEFTMPTNHKYYDLPKLLASDVDIYEDDQLIWYGRVLEINHDMNNFKKIYCEGPFAWFNDSIQRPQIFDTTTVHTFFNTVIANHNSQVPENRRFVIGDITVDDIEIYREFNYDNTKDVIENMCLGAEGGYLFFRKVDGVNYVDWLSDLPHIATQPIQFALNIVDISQLLSGEDICTSVIPLGKEDEDGVKLTIADVNMGLDYLDSEAVETYGRITKVVEFSDIGVATELLEAGQKWLTNAQFDPLEIKCDAAELHYLNGEYGPFMVGQKVKVISTPHLINKTLPLTAIDIQLDNPVKQVSVGTPKKRDLSEIYKPSNSGSSSGGSSGGGGGGGGSKEYHSGNAIEIDRNDYISVKIGGGFTFGANNQLELYLGRGMRINPLTGRLDCTIEGGGGDDKFYMLGGMMYSNVKPITDTKSSQLMYSSVAPIDDVMSSDTEIEPENSEEEI